MSGLYTWIISVLGSYEPVTYQTWVYCGEEGYKAVSVIPNGIAGVDWLYLAQVAVLCITIYCFFKLLGGILCKNF